MEVDGKEFLRNVGIEQDKERLIQEQKRLEELKRASVKREQDFAHKEVSANEEDSAFVDLSIDNDIPQQQRHTENNIDDIALDTSKSSDNKKKYIMLGFGLVLLFIITVLVIRLISNSETQSQLDNTEVAKETVTKDDILNKIDTNEQYQEVIDKKNQLSENNAVATKEKEIIRDLQVPEQEAQNVPLVIDTPKADVKLERDLFELDKSTSDVKKTVKQEIKQKVQPKIEKKVAVSPSKESSFAKASTNVSGYFIQIGAFTKEPNKSLLRTIVAKGYKYKIYKVTIKGRLYNKLLVGPFSSRADAVKKLSNVKTDFNNPNAYILKI